METSPDWPDDIITPKIMRESINFRAGKKLDVKKRGLVAIYGSDSGEAAPLASALGPFSFLPAGQMQAMTSEEGL